jgi:hypothetical protein
MRQSEAWIRGSGSTTKCHGSGTLLATYLPVWKFLGWSGLPFNRGERGKGGERAGGGGKGAGGGGERAGRGAGLPHHSSILNIFYI